MGIPVSSLKVAGKITQKLGIGTASGLIVLSACYFSQALGQTNIDLTTLTRFIEGAGAFIALATSIAGGMEAAKFVSNMAIIAVVACALESTMILGALMGIYEVDTTP